MKRRILTILVVICMIFSIVPFSACENITEILDEALRLEELEDYVQNLEEENLMLKSELATLKFELKYPDHVVGNEDLIELINVNLKVTDQENGGDALIVTDKAQVVINGGSYHGGQTPFGGAGNTAVWVKSTEAKVTINDGYFYINGLATDEEGNKDSGHIDLIYCSAGTIEINGGWFEGANSDVWLLNCKDASYLNGTASIIVKGGTFVNFNPAEVYTEPTQPISYVAEGYQVVPEVVGEDTYYKVIKQ